MKTKHAFLNALPILVFLFSSLGWHAVEAALSLDESTINILFAKPDGLATGDCLAWENACDLQTALNAAEPGDEIWAAKGIYYHDPTRHTTATFQLKSGVALYGGFSGTETEREQRDWVAHMTILSGDIDRNDVTDPFGVVTDPNNIEGHNYPNIVSSYGVTETAVLDGFTITAGNAHTCETTALGGGMYNENSSPTLSNVIFSGNATNCDGGGMYSSGSPSLSNVTFSGNRARNGGGMYSSGSPSLSNVTFSVNYANDGGGMYSSGSPTLTNVTFSANGAAYGNGGGMYSSGSPSLSNVAFSANYASYLCGGGMYSSGAPTLFNITFSGNSASCGGGMYNSGNPSLSNVTFSGNFASDGGGMYNYYHNPTLSNVTFSENVANGAGGGMYIYFGSPTLSDVTFTVNRASYGGGMFNDFGDPTLTNAILWGNTPDQIYNRYNNNTVTVTYSDIQGGFPGNGNIDRNPLLGPLADNGGITWTQALLSRSPAIDAGDPQNCPATDQRGVIRPVDGDQDGVAICDMGAYEYDPLAITKLIYLPLLRK